MTEDAIVGLMVLTMFGVALAGVIIVPIVVGRHNAARRRAGTVEPEPMCGGGHHVMVPPHVAPVAPPPGWPGPVATEPFTQNM